MRAVIQRVSRASVKCDSGHYQEIQTGIMVLLGIEDSDNRNDVKWLATKICNLRIFPDEEGIMNLSLLDCGGDLLVVSQFTLHASTKKGNRPSYIKAARPEIAIPLYEEFIEELHCLASKEIKHGVFGDHMIVDLVNDGPVTIVIDTKNKE